VTPRLSFMRLVLALFALCLGISATAWSQDDVYPGELHTGRITVDLKEGRLVLVGAKGTKTVYKIDEKTDVYFEPKYDKGSLKDLKNDLMIRITPHPMDKFKIKEIYIKGQ
jgi:hypothetical protein